MMGDIVPESNFRLDPVSGPEFRRDPITGNWIIFSPERGKRILPPNGKLDVCPFCSGNEDQTPLELFSVREPGSLPNDPQWRVRAIPNRFPAVRNNEDLFGSDCEFLKVQAGMGFHEVIAECSHHETRLSQLSAAHLADVVHVWVQRFRSYRSHPDFRFVQIFKNHGMKAGASLEHCHSQLIAIPMVPKWIQEEVDHAVRYQQTHARCVFCDLLDRERRDHVRWLGESDGFAAITAFAARWPFETWILPKRHLRSLDQITRADEIDLGHFLHRLLTTFDERLQDPPYNLVFHNPPFDSQADNSFHWHIEILPRLSQPAGWEWATGWHINPVPPEQAARFLRW